MKRFLLFITLLFFASTSLSAQIPLKLVDTMEKTQAAIFVAKCKKNVPKIIKVHSIYKAPGLNNTPPKTEALTVFFPKSNELICGIRIGEYNSYGKGYVDYSEIQEVISFLEWAKLYIKDKNMAVIGETLAYRFICGKEISIRWDGTESRGGVAIFDVDGYGSSFEKNVDVFVDIFQKALSWLDEQKALLKK